MAEIIKAPALTSAFLFTQLTARLKGKPEAQERVLAHIRAVSNHTTLPAFHNNGATETEKLEVYGVCLQAVIKNDFSLLKGQVPKGQAQSPPDEGKTAPPPVAKVQSYKLEVLARGETAYSANGCRFATADEAKEYGNELSSRWMAVDKTRVAESEDPVNYRFDKEAYKAVPIEEKDASAVLLPEPKPETTATVTTPPPVIVVPVGDPKVQQPAVAVDPKIAAVIAALQGLSQPVAGSQPIDEAAIRKIVEQVMAEEVQKVVAFQVEKRVHEAKFELLSHMKREYKAYCKEVAEALVPQ